MTPGLGTATAKRRGRRPAAESKIVAPRYKTNETERTWNGKGFLRLPSEFEALIDGGCLYDFHEMRFLWEIMKAQWGVAGKPIAAWTRPLPDKELLTRLRCSNEHLHRIKLDLLTRGLIEARRDGRSLRYSARIERWPTAAKAPAGLSGYDEQRKTGINAPVGHLWDSLPALDPGATIPVPAFLCRGVSSDDLDCSLQVRRDGGTLQIAKSATAAAQGAALRVASERTAKTAEASATRAIARAELTDRVEEVLAPYFVRRNFVVDEKLKRAIADAITRVGATIEQFANFIPGKLAGEYSWRPGLFLARGGFMDDFGEFVRQARSAKGPLPDPKNGHSHLDWLDEYASGSPR
jgi:hypothetical protein